MEVGESVQNLKEPEREMCSGRMSSGQCCTFYSVEQVLSRTYSGKSHFKHYLEKTWASRFIIVTNVPFEWGLRMHEGWGYMGNLYCPLYYTVQFCVTLQLL